MKRSKMLSKEWYENWFSGKEKILGFNIGRPHPGLIEVLDNHLLKPGRVLVPACGIGYDAVLLAQRGFEVVAFDFSVNAIKKAKSKVRSTGKLKGSLKFVVEDIYN
ncbi:MAG: methyltransferase domain-containing protein, partial [Desulfobacteraceae bacterium]|nr:methyltransferase domain-containing protein [Desulfobacteraceae bacterium]